MNQLASLLQRHTLQLQLRPLSWDLKRLVKELGLQGPQVPLLIRHPTCIRPFPRGGGGARGKALLAED